MKIQKLGGSLAAVILLSGAYTVAMADPTTCDELVQDIKDITIELRCADYGDAHDGIYSQANPLWQKRGKVYFGCEVHESLAKALFFDRAITGEPPPVKKGGNAKGGAAQDLANGYVDAAVSKLLGFLSDVENAKDNEAWVPAPTDQPESYFTDAVNGFLGYAGLCY